MDAASRLDPLGRRAAGRLHAGRPARRHRLGAAGSLPVLGQRGENIALARPDATRAQIEEAARQAAVHDDIQRLPRGYDTPVGERGVTLSGGQRQRVAIARALLADAPLLLLDDALSAVDTGTEAQILATLRQARQGRTVIIASHRLSTLLDADHIVVLRHGHVTERGTHRELVDHDGWYAKQWRVQQLEASLDAE
jgi:ATP-binding cassette subfamily B protein/ATP-binding cassette subfamily C protein/ATP-binding cassette subfamily B multidrug efflux pump